MVQLSPIRGKSFHEKPWEGAIVRKPWHYRVTVAIPVMDSFEAVSVIVDVLRLQTERPYIVLIDTGSTPEQLSKIQSLRADDVEVHCLAFNAVRHPSDYPAIAMDLAFSMCRTEWILATHADCFLTGRKVIDELKQLCTWENPVVGYEITKRPHSDWRGMVGHTLTMFHVPRMDSINASWSMRRLCQQYEHPDGVQATHEINPAQSPNWPDTEILINYQCREHGIVPQIIGTEENARRTQDSRIDHCRSWASAKLYAGNSTYANTSNGWLEDGIAKAKERIRQWINREA